MLTRIEHEHARSAFEENGKGTLDFLQVGTFNEHIAQPQPNAFATKQNQSWVRTAVAAAASA
jgi:hypothetical protein